MDMWDRVRNTLPLPVMSLIVSMLLLLLAKLGKKALAVAGCAAAPFVMGGFAWYREWDTLVVPSAVFLGLIPGVVLAVGIHLWCAPDRPRSAVRALATAASVGLVPCVATFYAFVATDCIFKPNGGCDDPLFIWGTAVATSWPLGVVISAMLTKVPVEPLPWEK
jgi:hypothetical protein